MSVSIVNSYGFLVMTCFGAEINLVSRSALEALDAHGMRRRFSIRRDEPNFRLIYSGTPTPGGAHLKRALFFEPSSSPGTTALLADLEDGWWTLVNATAARVSGTHAQFRFTQGDTPYPTYGFEVWSDGKSIRSVSCSRNDRGKWEFISNGTPLEFEDTAAYSRRRVAERLSQQMIIGYMSALGWDVERSTFWCSKQPGVYLEEIRTQA
jgi:hypothetical protein